MPYVLVVLLAQLSVAVLPQHFGTLSSIAQVKVAPASIDVAVLPVPRSTATSRRPYGWLRPPGECFVQVP